MDEILLTVKKFIFNPIEVNAYVVWDQSLECVLIDPSCYYPKEEQALKQFIESNKLKPVRLLNTHGHFDHLMGNGFVYRNWDLKCEIHQDDNYLIDRAEKQAERFGIEMQTPPSCGHFLQDGETISFGNSELKVIHVPGHSPGGVAFYSENERLLFTGDILFYRSIGRTDLPMGNFDLLITGIKEKLLCLNDKVKVYCGHGPETSIGFEKLNNPYLRQ